MSTNSSKDLPRFRI